MTISKPPRVYVLAGVNGAGKSSIAGAAFRQLGGDYYNTDEVARKLRAAEPALSPADANSMAWHAGVRLLERAIEERLDYSFETTLGGNTITKLLARAASQGIELYVWYVGLSSPELHIERVLSRVSKGGHDIPPEQIHQRFERSRLNLIELLPLIAGLRLYDNSVNADPSAGHAPNPTLILHVEHGNIVYLIEPQEVPDWSKPIVAAALKGMRS
jgi:predicted ABC-type ATPase